MLFVIDQELRQFASVSTVIKESQEMMVNAPPDQKEYLQNAIVQIKSSNKRSPAQFEATQYFLNQCQQSGINLQGSLYDDINGFLQEEAKTST